MPVRDKEYQFVQYMRPAAGNIVPALSSREKSARAGSLL